MSTKCYVTIKLQCEVKENNGPCPAAYNSFAVAAAERMAKITGNDVEWNVSANLIELHEKTGTWPGGNGL